MEVRKLTPELVIAFAQVKAIRKQAEDEEKAAVPEVKALLEDDKNESLVHYGEKKNEEGETIATYTYAPSESPYQLVYSLFSKRDVSWKDEFMILFKEKHGKDWKKAFAKFEAEIPKVDADSLTCPTNPFFKKAKDLGIVARKTESKVLQMKS